MIMEQARLTWMLASLATVPIMVGLCVWKWHGLLKVVGEHVSMTKLACLYITGQFYNFLLPSSSGGDVVRMALLCKETRLRKHAVSSIIIERFIGLIVLSALAGLSLLMAPEIRQDRILLAATLAGNGLAVVILIFAFSTWATAICLQRLRRFRWAQAILSKILTVQKSLWSYRRHKRQLLIALLQSAGFYLTAVAGVYFASLSFGFMPRFESHVMIVPIVLTITLLPITIGALGLWEWSFTAAFSAFGMPAELGLSVSLLLRARDVIWSIGGYALILLCFVSRNDGFTPKAMRSILQNKHRQQTDNVPPNVS